MTRSRARINVLRSAHLRVIGTERVNTTFGVMFDDPVAGRTRIMYDLVAVKMRAQMAAAARNRTRAQGTRSARDGQAS
jgi:hypothetical protein